MMKISNVVPVYNMSRYLDKCISSIRNQSYTNLEIIIIDDGSTDGSSDIVDKYARSDSRIIAIHEENQGESHARNVGLEHATGDYIAFVDCDDWIEPDMYETLLSAAVRDDIDMVSASWYKETENENGSWLSQAVKNENSVNSNVFGRDELLHYLYKRDKYRGFSYMWDKLYKREILMDNSGRFRKFDESIRLGGDVIYLAEAALMADRNRYIDRPFYHYRIRKKSGSHTENPHDMHEWVEAYETVIKEYEAQSIDENILDYLRRFLAYHASQGIKLARKSRDKEEEEYFKAQMTKYQNVYERLNVSHPEWIEEYRKILKS